jgi:hypothetical protein
MSYETVAAVQNARFIAPVVVRIQNDEQIQTIFARVINNDLQMAPRPVMVWSGIGDVERGPSKWIE